MTQENQKPQIYLVYSATAEQQGTPVKTSQVRTATGEEKTVRYTSIETSLVDSILKGNLKDPSVVAVVNSEEDILKKYLYLLISDIAEKNAGGVWISKVRTIDGEERTVSYTSSYTLADFNVWSKQGAENDVRVVAVLNGNDDILSTTFRPNNPRAAHGAQRPAGLKL